MTIIATDGVTIMADRRSSSLRKDNTVAWTDTITKITDVRGKGHKIQGKEVQAFGLSGSSGQNARIHRLLREGKGYDIEHLFNTMTDVTPEAADDSTMLILCGDGFVAEVTVATCYSRAYVSVKSYKLNKGAMSFIGSGGGIAKSFHRINPSLSLALLFSVGSYLDNRSSQSGNILSIAEKDSKVEVIATTDEQTEKNVKRVLRACANIKEFPKKVQRTAVPGNDVREHF